MSDIKDIEKVAEHLMDQIGWGCSESDVIQILENWQAARAQQSGEVPEGWRDVLPARQTYPKDEKSAGEDMWVNGWNSYRIEAIQALSKLYTHPPKAQGVPEFDLPAGYSVRFDPDSGWHWYDDVNDRPAEEKYASEANAVIGAWKDVSHRPAEVPTGWYVHRYSDCVSLANKNRNFRHRRFFADGNDDQAMIASFLSDLVDATPPADKPEGIS